MPLTDADTMSSIKPMTRQSRVDAQSTRRLEFGQDLLGRSCRFSATDINAEGMSAHTSPVQAEYPQGNVRVYMTVLGVF